MIKMDDADYISEFEELLKIKEFSQNSKMKMPFDCTYELIGTEEHRHSCLPQYRIYHFGIRFTSSIGDLPP
jgi:hypothetical protein